MAENTTTRRQFVTATTAAAAGVYLASTQTSADGREFAANETIRVGMIGPGGRGSQLMRECAEFGREYGAKVTAVCDIWNLRRDRGRDWLKDFYGNEPKVYKNIEALLKDKDIDAVIIATADHQHGKMLKMAVEAGKDVYVEKPMSYTIHEGRKMVEAARRNKRVVQVGIHRRSSPFCREAAEIVRSGELGQVTAARCGVAVNMFPAGIGAPASKHSS